MSMDLDSLLAPTEAATDEGDFKARWLEAAAGETLPFAMAVRGGAMIS